MGRYRKFWTALAVAAAVTAIQLGVEVETLRESLTIGAALVGAGGVYQLPND